MTYIGIDVSKDSFVAAYPIENGYRTQTFKNSPMEIRKFIRTLSKEEHHCVMEATGNYSYLLLYLLSKAEITTSMENPLKIKSFARAMLSTTKTDELDAQMIALYGKRMEPAPFKMPTEAIMELKQKRAVIAQFKKQLRMNQNFKKSYYKYPKSIKPFTVKNNDKTGVLEYNQAGAVTLDADSLTELYTTTSILRPLIYSHTINPAFQKGDIPTGATDSIKSTTGDVICNTLNYNSENSRLVYDAKDMFVNAEKKVMSNGNAWITDSLRVKPWDSWCPIIHLRAQNGNFQAAVDKVSINQNVAVSSDNRNKNVEGSMHANQYYEVTSNLGSVPEVYFYIPEMWYTPYAVYLTMVPANITDEEAEVTSQKLQVRSFQNDAAGGTLTRFSPIPLKKDFNVSSNQASVVFDYGTNEKSKIVSKFMGVFNPSFCYRNLSNFTDPVAYPVFNIRSGDRAVKNQSAVLRIAGITLVPMEAVKYYQAQKALNGESGEEYKNDMPEIFWDLNSYTY